MKAQEFLASAGSHQVAGVYLLVGDEEYFQSEIYRIIREKMASKDPAVEVRRYGIEDEMDSARMASVVSDLQTPSLFSKTTLVRIDRAERVLSSPAEAFLSYVSSPPIPGRVLVLVCRSADRRTRGVKSIAKHGHWVECAKLFDAPPPWKRGRQQEEDHPLARWISVAFRNRGKRVGLPLAHLLSRRVGNDLFSLSHEIEKLVLYSGEGAVTEEAVEVLVGDRRQNRLYELTDSVLGGRVAEALSRLHRLFETGMVDDKGKLVIRDESIAFMVSGALNSSFRKIRKAHFHLRGVSSGRQAQERLVAAMRLRPFVAGRLAEQASRSGGVNAGLVLRRLIQLDRDLKGGLWPRRLAVFGAVAELGGLFGRSGRASGRRP
ncbi:MAG: hypothetical protein QF752_03280 [Planctomycetota bacterium]|jgi:DNA polymerase III delta subunit|nr:hypothetical protein [Planctomycetota bacterium]